MTLTVALLSGLTLACGFAAGRLSEPRVPTGSLEAAARKVDRSVVGITAEAAGRATERGSGFAIASGGLIATAAHVVAGADRIRVRLPDGRESEAALLGADSLSDVAILKVPGDLPPVETFATVRRGEVVAAIGDPLGFSGTLTVGHLSTPARLWEETNPYDVMQHDAALNPGSSGSALFDAEGRVVGLNVAIADGSRRNVGISLAVPIALVTRMADRLATTPGYVRPHLGVRLRNTDALRPAIPELTGGGAVVEAVAPGSAAATAGLAAGQIVVSAEGRTVRSIRDIALALEPKKAGDGFSLTVVTGDDIRRIAFRLDGPPAAGHSGEAGHPATDLGLALEPGEPPRVRAVAADAPSALAGLQPGDEVLSVGLGRLDPADPERSLAAAVRAGGAGGVALLVRRTGETRWVLVGPNGRLDDTAPFGSNAEAASSHSL